MQEILVTMKKKNTLKKRKKKKNVKRIFLEEKLEN